MAQLSRMLLVLGVFAACGGTPAKPAETPTNAAAPNCEGAAGPLVRAVTRKDAKADPASVTAEVTKRCQEDHWTEDAVNCMSVAHDKGNVHDCSYNHLTQAQADKLNEVTAPLSTMTASAAMDKMSELKDMMCACHDSACAQHVSDVMTKWSEDMSKEWKDPPKMTDDEVKRASAIGEAMGKCMQAAMSTGQPPPP